MEAGQFIPKHLRKLMAFSEISLLGEYHHNVMVVDQGGDSDVCIFNNVANSHVPHLVVTINSLSDPRGIDLDVYHD